MAQPIAAVIVAEAVVPAVVGDTGAGATDVAAGIILAVDMAGTAGEAGHPPLDPLRGGGHNLAVVGGVGKAPQRPAPPGNANPLPPAGAPFCPVLFVFGAGAF